jgi:exopolysaccharide biosynthesis protein
LTKKFHILFLILTLGFFLISNAGYACGKSSEKMTCEKKVTSNKETSDSCKKDCCSKKQSSKKDQHGCNGKCDHSNCTSTVLQFSMMAVNEFEFNNDLFNFSTEKPVSHHKTASISDGFISIWLLPKIK